MNWYIFGAILLPVIVGLVFFAWSIYGSKKVRIFLFEKVNKAHFFKESFKAKEKRDLKLGYYLEHKGKRFFMDEPSPDDFVACRKGRLLLVCCFGKDDFRVMKPLQDEVFYRRVVRPKLDAKGCKVLGKDGGVVYEEFEVPYAEPLGIAQEDKEVMRFARAYYKRMDEFEKGDESWWKKNAPLLINVAVIVLFFVFVVILLKVEAKTNEYWADRFGEKADEAISEMKNPSFFNRIIDAVGRKEVAGNAPPS